MNRFHMQNSAAQGMLGPFLCLNPTFARMRFLHAHLSSVVKFHTDFLSFTASAMQEAEKLKSNGNTLFVKGKFNAAADAYTDAILLCPTLPGGYLRS